MRRLAYLGLVFIILFTNSECSQETVTPESSIGHLRIFVTFPEVVYDEDGLIAGFAPVPGEGAVARLYNKDARCLGYKNAGFGIAHIGENSVQSKYVWSSNERGEIFFDNIQSGEYYLTIYARELYKYTEKFIEVTVGDTLFLAKNFTPSLNIFQDLEPWNYEIPNYP